MLCSIKLPYNYRVTTPFAPTQGVLDLPMVFADDCLQYRELIDTPNDCETLQSDLYKLETWANEWLMCFNINKCEVIQITLKFHSISLLFIWTSTQTSN